MASGELANLFAGAGRGGPHAQPMQRFDGGGCGRLRPPLAPLLSLCYAALCCCVERCYGALCAVLLLCCAAAVLLPCCSPSAPAAAMLFSSSAASLTPLCCSLPAAPAAGARLPSPPAPGEQPPAAPSLQRTLTDYDRSEAAKEFQLYACELLQQL